jgi:hypothetical protein
MAYVKKFDKALNTIIQCVEKGGKYATIVIDNTQYQAKVWNKFPICVQDICVDNIVLVDMDEDETNMLFGCDFDDDKTMTTSKETFDRRWRNLRNIKRPHVEYVARILNNLENVLDEKNVEKAKKTKNVNKV